MKHRLHIVFLCALLLLTAKTKAQEVQWSNSEKFRNRTAYTRIIGQNQQGIYALRSKSRFISRRVYIQMFRENMGLLFSKQLPGLKRSVLENAFVYPNSLAIFKSSYNRKTSNIDLIYQQYNIEAEPEGEEKVLMNSPQRDYSDEGDYILSQSTDRSKILCFHTEITSEKKTVIELLVLQAPEMKEISRKKVELPFRYGSFSRLDMEVDNNGSAYFVFRVEDDEKKKKNFERFGYYLFAYDINTNILKDFYLNNSDTYLSRPYLTIDNLNHRAIVSGFYSLQETGLSKGILDFAIDAHTHNLIYHSFIPYPQTFVADMIGKYAAERGEELRDLFIRKVIPHSDSGYVIVAEEFYTTTQTYTFSINGMMQVGSRDIFNFGKVALLFINKRGEIEWSKTINKSQTSSLDLGYYSSIYVVSQKNKLSIFYNDEDRGNSEITQYVLNNKGELSSKLLFKNQTSNIAVVPREGQQLDAATILFPAAKDRKFAFLKLMLN